MGDIVQTSRNDLQLVDSVLHGIICNLKNRPELNLHDATELIAAARSRLTQALTSLNTAPRHAHNALDLEQQLPSQPLVARKVIMIPRQPLVIKNVVTEAGQTRVHAMTESGLVLYEEYSRDYVPALEQNVPSSPSGQIRKERTLGTNDIGSSPVTRTALRQHDRLGSALAALQGLSSPVPGACARVETPRTRPLSQQNRHNISVSSGNDTSDLVKALSCERLNRQKEALFPATTKYMDAPGEEIQYMLGADEWVSPRVGSLLGNVSSAELRIIWEMWKQNIVPTKDSVQNQVKDELNRESY